MTRTLPVTRIFPIVSPVPLADHRLVLSREYARITAEPAAMSPTTSGPGGLRSG
ncbi:hypothetical protein [Gordonia insulae]|uniref:hypothetical protein n=1 Tax=Gordonia insulae TaxID=2420509 RepID=UPI0013DE3C26|nr:hypothetical protein [Gordonia insulae]